MFDVLLLCSNLYALFLVLSDGKTLTISGFSSLQSNNTNHVSYKHVFCILVYYDIFRAHKNEQDKKIIYRYQHVTEVALIQGLHQWHFSILVLSGIVFSYVHLFKICIPILKNCYLRQYYNILLKNKILNRIINYNYRTLHSFWKMNFVILLKIFCKITAVGDIKCF